MTLNEAAEMARGTSSRQSGVIYVTHTKAHGYRVEWSGVKTRTAVQEWNKGKRIDAAANCPYDVTTEAPKGSIK